MPPSIFVALAALGGWQFVSVSGGADIAGKGHGGIGPGPLHAMRREAVSWTRGRDGVSCR